MNRWSFDSGGHQRGAAQGGAEPHPQAFNVELSFRLVDEDDATRRRRLSLVGQALKDIAWRDDRMVSWEIAAVTTPGWVHIFAVVLATAPGEVAALSEHWMRSAIAAANLATDEPCVRLPAPREEATPAACCGADAERQSATRNCQAEPIASTLDTVTAQVSAAP